MSCPPTDPAVAARYGRRPDQVPEIVDDPAAELLRLGCLVYGADSQERLDRAAALLAARPSLGGATIHTAAAVGDVESVRAFLSADPDAAGALGGPFDWEPLLYLTYSRLAAPGATEVAALLLAAGADPNAGYLWDGSYPFTALTGAFGEGEDAANQPRHPDGDAIARLLLAGGADPNDSQALYNRMFGDDDSHLELLFSCGLGRGDGGPWHALLGDEHPTPAAMLHDLLLWAAANDQRDRVGLLLRHGVAAESPLAGHPLHRGQSAYELAVRAGNQEIADLLLAAGAVPVELTEVEGFLAACMRGDSAEVARLTSADPELPTRAIESAPTVVVHAATLGRESAVRLLVATGFDVNAAHRETPLHQAALTGNLALVKVLLELGADPSIVDCEFDSTPLGWAVHNHQVEVAEYLRTVD